MTIGRTIAPGPLKRDELKLYFQRIAFELENNRLNGAIIELYNLFALFEKKIKSRLGKPQRIATQKEIYDTSISDAIKLISRDFPGLEENYNEEVRKNGSILAEVLQNCLEKVANREDVLAVSEFTKISLMFKLFAGVTHTNCNALKVDFVNDVDPVAKDLNLTELLKPAAERFFDDTIGYSKAFLFGPSMMGKDAYQHLISPIGDLFKPKKP
jgi:hypothetical protein